MLHGKWRPGGGGVQDGKEGRGNHAAGLSGNLEQSFPGNIWMC